MLLTRMYAQIVELVQMFARLKRLNQVNSSRVFEIRKRHPNASFCFYNLILKFSLKLFGRRFVCTYAPAFQW